MAGPMDLEAATFKACPRCGQSWSTRNSFIHDPKLCLMAYEADFQALERGLFYFIHTPSRCGSMLGIPAKEFVDLYQGPRYRQRKTLTEECPRYCLDENELSRCDAKCKCAYVREALHLIHEAQLQESEWQ